MKKHIVFTLTIVSFLYANNLESLCKKNNFDACTDLGVFYAQKQNFSKTIELWTNACDGKNAKGCSSLGYIYAQGSGVKQDKKVAKEFYKKHVI